MKYQTVYVSEATMQRKDLKTYHLDKHCRQLLGQIPVAMTRFKHSINRKWRPCLVCRDI